MKRLQNSLLRLCALLLLLATGCGEDSEVFYSITYPVVRIDVEVTRNTPEPEGPSTGEDSDTDGTEGTDETEGTEGTEEEPEPVDPIVEQIQAEALEEAPVRAGGHYALDFTRYNGGPLTVDTAAESGVVGGEFVKEPGSSEIDLRFLDETHTCSISSFTDSDGRRKVLLLFDLTEEFQQRYPTAELTRVVRREYTSTPSN